MVPLEFAKRPSTWQTNYEASVILIALCFVISKEEEDGERIAANRRRN